ncbi:hypothetical protein M23134_05151 [Microscilla marina ATCC 23134]|uniref:Uncharacterized protein n=1 Tax=Microscilla marina ATCC 23134 TaxID=313606 RepID=A1ZDA6_MICM2|nr:hypothetical protein M23134_05151 [Microscilla marina ATCC 23134]
MAQNSVNYSTKVEDGKFCLSNKKKQDNSLVALLHLSNLFKVFSNNSKWFFYPYTSL